MKVFRALKDRPRLASYGFDYVVVILCIAGFSALDLAEPHHQQFALTDTSLQNPYAITERVPAVTAGIIAVLAPVVIMVGWCLILEGRVLIVRKVNLYGRLWELNSSILGLLLSVGLALVTTNIMKNTVGRPRPDLIDRCRPVSDADSLVAAFGLSNITVCTQTNHAILKDGYRSFPSGHSSSAFSGLGYLAIWLAGKLRTLDGSGQIWKVVIITIPILGATLIAASRIMDARHHAFDVLFGSALGIAAAWISYRQYFPDVRSGGVSYGPREMKSSTNSSGISISRNTSEQERRPQSTPKVGSTNPADPQGDEGPSKILVIPPAQMV